LTSVAVGGAVHFLAYKLAHDQRADEYCRSPPPVLPQEMCRYPAPSRRYMAAARVPIVIGWKGLL
jgi:hypothetical protein